MIGIKKIKDEIQNSNSPVILKIKKLDNFGKTKEERIKKIYNYYSGQAQKDGKHKNRTYLEYITRNDAVEKYNLSREEIIELDNLRKNNEKLYKQKLEEIIKTKQPNLGIWSKNGAVDKKRLEEIKQNLLNLEPEKQFVWDTIISFDEIFAEKYKTFTPESIYRVLKERINDLFWSKKIDPESMEWFFSYHKNTDNPHIHLLFFEKDYTRYGKNYETKYNFDPDVLADFRYGMARDLILTEKNFEVKKLNESRNNIVNFFKESFKKPLLFFKTTWSDVKEIYNDLTNNYGKILQEINQFNRNNAKGNFKEVRKLTYSMLNKVEQKKLNTLINHILKCDSKVNNEFKTYLQNLEIYEDIVNEAKGEKISNFKYESLYGKDGLYSRIGNKVLASIKRNRDVSNKGLLLPEYYSKITKIKISIINNLMRRLDNLIFSVNKFLSVEINKTKEVLKERGSK